MAIPLNTTPDRRAAYWKSVRRLTLLLLATWLLVTFGVVFFARELAGFTLLGWPLSFYMAAQGTIIVYVAIVAVYAWRMRRLDQAFRDEGGDGK